MLFLFQINGYYICGIKLSAAYSFPISLITQFFEVLMNLLFASFETITGMPVIFGYIFTFVFGALVGSFLNVVIHRVPRKESIVFPNSACPKCKNPIKPYDNLPILSWLILGGKCRKCKEKISPRYPAVELLTALLFGLTFWAVGFNAFLPVCLIFVTMMVSLIFIDAEHKILPDVINLPLLGLVLLARIFYPIFFSAEYFTDLKHSPISTIQNLPMWLSALIGAIAGCSTGVVVLWLASEIWYHFQDIEEDEEDLHDTIFALGPQKARSLKLVSGFIGAVAGAALLLTIKNPPGWLISIYGAILGGLVGGGFLWLVGEIWKRLRGVDAMGLGDVKMMFAVGALLGWRLTLLSLFLGAFSGAIIGIVVVSRQKVKDMQTQIPFGIFLGIGSIIALFFGEQIIGWYIRTFIPG